LTPKDSVAVDLNFCESDPLWVNYYHLRTGKKCSPDDVGMWYEFQVTDLKGYAGNYQLEFVQVITVDWKQNLTISTTNNPHWSKYTEGRGLDAVYPYQSWMDTISGYADDTPNDVLIETIAFDWRRDNFECYLMFKPEGGQFVPLKLAMWNWYGRAEQVGTNSPPVFAGRPPFTNPLPAFGADCYTHPEWTNNVNYLQTHWTYQPFWYITP
jgi:hypothetical protein